MSDDQIEYQVKTQSITESKFKSQANEYLAKMEEFKKLEKKMKQWEVNIKQYMVDNDIREFKSDIGTITIVERKVSVLNRALIDDIEQYYQETRRKIMYKSIN